MALKELSCPYCLSPLGESDRQAVCGECEGRYHEECWEENGGCATFGCPAWVPTQQDEFETPAVDAGAVTVAPAPAAAGALAPAHFCDMCGQAVATTDQHCAACGSALYEVVS